MGTTKKNVKTAMKRVLVGLLALAMVLGTIPASSLTVHAAENSGAGYYATENVYVVSSGVRYVQDEDGTLASDGTALAEGYDQEFVSVSNDAYVAPADRYAYTDGKLIQDDNGTLDRNGKSLEEALTRKLNSTTRWLMEKYPFTYADEKVHFVQNSNLNSAYRAYGDSSDYQYLGYSNYSGYGTFSYVMFSPRSGYTYKGYVVNIKDAVFDNPYYVAPADRYSYVGGYYQADNGTYDKDGNALAEGYDQETVTALNPSYVAPENRYKAVSEADVEYATEAEAQAAVQELKDAGYAEASYKVAETKIWHEGKVTWTEASPLVMEGTAGDQASISVLVGSTTSVSAMVTDNDQQIASVKYSVKDSSIVSVSNSGNSLEASITAKKAGTTKVQADVEINGVTYSLYLTVTAVDPKAATINFKYYNSNNAADLAAIKSNADVGSVNTVKYTVELVDSNGNVVTGSAYDSFYNSFSDVNGQACTADSGVVPNVLFGQFSAPAGYTFETSYWYWGGTYDSEKKTVKAFYNMGCKSTAYSSYNSYIAYDSDDYNKDDWNIGNTDRVAYNPTGTLHVVYKAEAAPAITIDMEDWVYDADEGIWDHVVSYTVDGVETTLSDTDNIDISIGKQDQNGRWNFGYSTNENMAGTYKIVVSYTRTDNGQKSEASDEYVISPAPITITVADAEMYKDGNTPAYSATVKYADGEDASDLVELGTYSVDENNKISVSYTVTTRFPQNYTFSVVEGTLTVKETVAIMEAISLTETYNKTNLLAELEAQVNAALDNAPAGYTYTVTKSAEQGIDAGTYTITVSSTYDGAPCPDVVNTLTIVPRDVTIDAQNASKTYGEADPTFTATALGTVNGDKLAYSVSRTGSDENAGSYEDVIVVTVDENAAVNKNYNITVNAADFTINKKDASIVVTDGQTKAYGSDDPAAYEVSVSGTVNNETLDYTVVRAAGEDAGEYALSVALTEGSQVNSNYNITTTGSVYTITPYAVDLSGNVYNDTKTYDNMTYSREYSVQGPKDSVITVTASTDAKNVGTYVLDIVTDVDGNSNYAVTYPVAESKLTINVRNAEVFVDDATKEAGEDDPFFTYRTTGIALGDSITFGCWRAVGDVAGTYTIYVSPVFNPNYRFTYHYGTLTITGSVVEVIEDEETPAAPAPAAVVPAAPVVTPVAEAVTEEPVVEEPAEVVEEPVTEVLEEEPTPLAPTVETETIEDEPVAQTHAASDSVCYIHWMILAAAVVLAVYEALRFMSREKEIKNLK